MKRMTCIILAFVLLLGLCGCNNNTDTPDKHYDADFYEEYPTGDEIHTVEVKKNPVATVILTDGSEIEIELRYDVAPNAVANFIAFADEKIYDKMGFTTVKNNCIVMSGAMQGEFEPPYYIQDEINDGKSDLSHVRGTVSMIRMSTSDTLTGQFFILTNDQIHFDSNFTAFGTVTKGLEHIDKIAASEKGEGGNVITPVGIASVSVNTFGEKFPLPTIIYK